MRGGLAIAAVLAVLGLGGEARACSILPPTAADYLANKRVKQKADCSFVNSGLYDTRSGEAARDLGRSRVMQRITSDNVVLTDCAVKSIVVVMGKADPALETSCGPVFELQRFEVPNGPVDYTLGADLQQFSAILTRQGFVVANPPTLNVGERPKDIVDYFCGCKLFYPDSAGARD